MFSKALFTYIFLTGFILISQFANAQLAGGGGTVSGHLVDATNGQPLDFATVSLFRKPDKQPVKSMQTDAQGNFKFQNINDGTYFLRVIFVSYLTYTRDTLVINPNRRVIELGTIKMRPAKNILKEVVVKSQKSQIQLSTDKKVFSVDQSLVSQGGSATDLLTNVPSVQVDVDGNVSLRGSSNVRILINGKPSALTGANLSDILQSIPASSIETIEVITNPSSKYDAEGESGIINIVLKRNAQLGFNGSVSGTVGTNHTYNGTVNLAYQNKHINIYSNYSYRKATRIGNGYSNTTSLGTDIGDVYQNQVNDQTFMFEAHNVRSGIDFTLDPKTTLSLSNNINIRNINRYQNGYNTLNSSVLQENITRNNYSPGHGHNVDFNLDFDHKYKKKDQELTADIGYSTSRNTNNDYLNSMYSGALNGTGFGYPRDQSNLTLGKQYNINLQADYVLPLNHSNRLEMGYRSTFNRNDNNYMVDTLDIQTSPNMFVPSDTLSDHFIYNEQIHAVYTNYQQSFGKFSIQGGVRLEDTHIKTQTTTLNIPEYHIQDYLRVYPTLFLTDKLTENQTIQLSYSRRVSRPRDRQISPFLDRSDPQNWQQGNPDLMPEDTHSFELSYINYWKSLTLTSSLYYRLTNDNIQPLRYLVNGTTTLMRFENLKSAANGGYELIAKVSPSNAIDLTGNVNVYYRNIQDDPALGVQSTSGFAWNGNLTANIKPVKKLGIQLRGDYQGPQVIAQGHMKAMYGVDGGIRYDITKVLNLSVNSRDIFNTRSFGSYVISNNGRLTQFSDRRFSSRIVMTTLSYRFGSATGTGRKRNRDQQQQQDQDVPDEGGMSQGNAGANGGGQPVGGGAASGGARP